MGPLKCRGLCKSFGRVQVLKDVSAEFSPGGITALVGPNGAGKTCLLDVVSGFARADSGQCLLGSVEIGGLPAYRIARMGVCRTFQDIRLAPQMSAVDHLLLACGSVHGRSASSGGWVFEQADVRFGSVAADVASVVELGGLSAVGRRMACELSYGQQRLLSIVCSIATQAEVFLLDEPTAGLCGAVGNSVLMLFRKLAEQGKLVVFAEHDLDAVLGCAQRVLAIDHGQVTAFGSPNEVLAQITVAPVGKP